MFHSTRGKELLTSPEAILKGLADDGGLFVIDKLPELDYHDLLNDDYKLMASKIINAFFPEFTFEEIKKEIDEAYSAFDIDSVVDLKRCDNAYFLELFHGPTLAFKDLALVVLPRLMKLSKRKLGYEKNITILTATSGDTGGAALNGFKGIDGVSIVVLYPDGGVSPIQEAQMCSFRGDNAKVLAIKGNFDDCQNLVKDFFNNHKELSISSANSINIARLVPQVVYYFYSYVELLRRNEIADGEKINFDVPTGNFGNIFAGFYAKMMGLPINNLICASNKNAVLTDFFNNGKYDKRRPFFKTNSPSMDILISSNLERLVYYGTSSNEDETSALMNSLKNNGQYDFNNPFDFFNAYSTDEAKTLEVIKDVYNKYNYLIDPHTAVAYNAYLKYANETKNNLKTVVVSTASPYKFPQAILEAFNIECNDPLKAINVISERFNIAIPAVLNYPLVVRENVDLSDAESYVVNVIKCFK
ncbi:MAG: threonine synthase [Erysipelotrichaceae bacterium]|nr:threonine synthase [Erysipelotrichaceae bacterium]